MTGSKGSPEGPAWAGAIIVAVSAATISSAERKEANIRTVKSAVNQQNERLYFAITYACARRDSPSRVAFPAIAAEEMPPALVVETGVTPMFGGVNPLTSFQR